jgi:hypothetical protein
MGGKGVDDQPESDSSQGNRGGGMFQNRTSLERVGRAAQSEALPSLGLIREGTSV